MDLNIAEIIIIVLCVLVLISVARFDSKVKKFLREMEEEDKQEEDDRDIR